VSGMRWHPDHNPQAQEQMKALNSAVEPLGGRDVGVLFEQNAASFVRHEDSAEFEYSGARFTVLRLWQRTPRLRLGLRRRFRHGPNGGGLSRRPQRVGGDGRPARRGAASL
jgi:hypothetical protein